MLPDDLTLKAVQALHAENAMFLSRLNEHLQGMLPVYTETFASSGTVAEASTESLIIPPTRDTYFKVTGLFVSVPLNTVEADLELGSQFDIPLQNTTTLLTPIQKILRSTDIMTLNFTTGADNGGQAFVWLWGEAIPSYGKL
jgi:hypothetical protein